MTRDDFIQSLASFPSLDLVKAFKNETPTESNFECYVNDDNSRTQIINIWLDEEKQDVVAISQIGDAPDDADTLKKLLMENTDGHYSRLAIFNDILVQVYKYALNELEEKEMYYGFLEVAKFADFYEDKYFDGADSR